MLTAIWDVDDILNDLMYQWFHHGWLPEHPECSLAYSGLTSNPPHALLGVEQRVYLESMDRFRRTKKCSQMTPNAEVLAWFRERGHLCRHVALTARPLESAPDAAWWVMHHFGAWIRCFGVVPTRAPEGTPVYDRSKAEFLAWLRTGDILIDDSIDNVREAEELGLRTLQPAQPWNRSNLPMSAVLRQLTEWAGER